MPSRRGERCSVTEIDLDRDRYLELQGRAWHVWLRRAFLALFAAFCVAGLFNAFGQETTLSVATSPEAILRIEGPPRLRAGLLYQVRFTMQPVRHAVSHPKLVLNQNWFENMTLNSATPNPSSENSRGGRITMAFPPLGRGKRLTLLTEWQVNPAQLGRRELRAAFVDGNTPLVTQHRTLTVFP
jgi:hypothetical protein